MFIVAKVITAVDSLRTRLSLAADARTPMSKDRILKILSDIPEVAFQQWTNYFAEERDGATEHFIASDELWAQVSVFADHATFAVFSRATQSALAQRTYRWDTNREDAPVFSCLHVTEEELSYLRTLGATEMLLPDATAKFFGNLMDWKNQRDPQGRTQPSFGSEDRVEEVISQLFEAARNKLGVAFLI
jgi:AcrR family transcriptional regulator